MQGECAVCVVTYDLLSVDLRCVAYTERYGTAARGVANRVPGIIYNPVARPGSLF